MSDQQQLNEELLRSAEYGDLSGVKSALDKGADVNCTDVAFCQFTPLHYTSENGYTEIAKCLIDSNANVNSKDQDGNTSLHIASSEGKSEVVQILITVGCSKEIANNRGDTPLHCASEWGRTEVVSMLLNAGAKKDATNSTGNTSLHLASSGGKFEVVQILITAGCNTEIANNSGLTPLHVAGNSDTASVLLSAGVPVDIASNNGWMPRYCALYNRRSDVVDVLVAAGAQEDTVINNNIQLLLACENGDLTEVQRLVQHNVDINCTDDIQQTPLHIASDKGYNDIVKYLLDSKANPNSKNKYCDTPLHRASYMGRSEVVNMLLSAGAEKDATNSDGDTALNRACDGNKPEVVKLLISAGVDIHLCSNEGYTALHCASFWGQSEIVQILLTAGCKIDADTDDGETPLDIAKKYGRHEVIEILETFVTSEQKQQQENKQTSEGQHVPDQTQQHSDATSTISDVDITFLKEVVKNVFIVQLFHTIPASSKSVLINQLISEKLIASKNIEDELETAVSASANSSELLQYITQLLQVIQEISAPCRRAAVMLSKILTQAIRDRMKINIDDLLYADVSDTLFLHKLIEDIDNFEELGSNLSIELQALKSITERNSDDSQNGRKEVILSWLQISRPTADIETLIEAAEKTIRNDLESFNKIDQEQLDKALNSGYVKTNISKLIIQGPARVGKTSVKSMITKYPYSELSTNCMEPPLIAVGNVNRYIGTYDGTHWKFIDDDEMLNRLLGQASFPQDKRGTTPTKKSAKKSTKYSHIASRTSSSTDAIDREKKSSGSSHVDRPLQQTAAKDAEVEEITASKPTPIQIEAEKVLKESRGILGKMRDSVVGRKMVGNEEWLYFIDSGGQIQYQQLLHAFLPCASVLLLVINMAENLSDQCSTVLNCVDGERSVSEYCPTNETLLEQLILMINASSERQKALINSDSHLSKFIKPPEKLQIMAIATHMDEYEKKEGNHETIEEKQKKFERILDSLKDHLYCPNFSAGDFFYKVDGRKAKRGDFDDPVIDQICEELRKQAFEVDVPLRWHVLEILLRKTSKVTHGVLSIDICNTIGQESLNMSPEEIRSSLKFFHLLNTVLYYPNSQLPDIVFTQPALVYDIVSELAVCIVKIRNGENVGGGTLDLKEAGKGYISRDIIGFSKKCQSVCESVPEFNSKLLSLFEYLLLAVPKNGKKYFMPALLPLVDPSQVTHSYPCPFLFHFEKGAPIGLFCSFIVYLLSNCSNRHIPDWVIPDDAKKLHANCITLERIGKCQVLFIEYCDRFEIRCEKKYQPEIREEICKVMNSFIMKNKITEETQPSNGFYCPCPKEIAHVAIIDERKRQHTLFCLKTYKVLNCDGQYSNDLCWSWLGSNCLDILYTEPKVSEVLEVLTPIHHKWDTVAVYLNIDVGKRQGLRQTNDRDDSKMTQVIERWIQLNGEGGATPVVWETIIDVVEKIGNKKLGSDIHKYLEKLSPNKSQSNATSLEDQQPVVNTNSNQSLTVGNIMSATDSQTNTIGVKQKQQEEKATSVTDVTITKVEQSQTQKEADTSTATAVGSIDDVDVDTLKSIIDKVLFEKLKKLSKRSVESVCAELFKDKLISAGVATVDDIIEDLKESLDIVEESSEVISMYSNILKVIYSVPGPCVTFAKRVSTSLVKEIKNKWNIDVVLL